MVPTAISQIFEQITNVMVSIIATYMFMSIYRSAGDGKYGYGAMGSTMRTLSSVIIALIIMLFFYIRKKKQVSDSKQGVSLSIIHSVKLLPKEIASRLLKPIFFKAFTSYFSKIPPLFLPKHLTNPQKNAALRALNY